jgi:hypothetical protein
MGSASTSTPAYHRTDDRECFGTWVNSLSMDGADREVRSCIVIGIELPRGSERFVGDPQRIRLADLEAK